MERIEPRASAFGSRSPAVSAAIMARPETPKMSEQHRHLDQRVFEQILHPLFLRGAGADQVDPVPGQVPQLAKRRRAAARSRLPLPDRSRPPTPRPPPPGPPPHAVGTGSTPPARTPDQPGPRPPSPPRARTYHRVPMPPPRGLQAQQQRPPRTPPRHNSPPGSNPANTDDTANTRTDEVAAGCWAARRFHRCWDPAHNPRACSSRSTVDRFTTRPPPHLIQFVPGLSKAWMGRRAAPRRVPL